MTNCEFSTFYQWSNTGSSPPVARSEDWIFNNEGVNIGTMHRTPVDADIDAKTVVEWYRQMKAGKGPMHYINPSKNIRIAPVSPPGTRPLPTSCAASPPSTTPLTCPRTSCCPSSSASSPA